MRSSSTSRPSIARICARVSTSVRIVCVEQLVPVQERQSPRGVQRGRQQRARAGRFGQRNRAVDRVLADSLDAAVAEMQHRRLREAADDLVRAGDDQVGAQRQRVRGQILMEGHVRAPRLIDDQRDVVGMRDRRQRAHVRDGAEVGGRDDPRAHRRRRPRQRGVERLGEQAVRDAQLRIDLRRDERRAHARQDQRVDGARVGVSLHHHLVAVMGERETGREVALRRAVDQKPGPPRPPRLGGQPLGLLKRRRLWPDVDAVCQRGNVQAQRTLADRLAQLRVRAEPALVARNVQARGVAVGVCAQRVEVRRPLLLCAHPNRLDAPAVRAGPAVVSGSTR